MKTKTTATIALCLISLILFTIVTQGQTDLNIWQAASTGNVAVVEEHLAKGADINAQDGVYGVTPLSWAALLGQTQMAELLIQRGANVNSKNRDGATSLHAAAFLGRHEIAALLVQKGANTNVRNNSGEIPADSLKADWGTVQFIVQLLQIQVDREKVESGRAKVAELLSQQGAQTGFAGFTGNDIWSAVGSGDIETIKQQLAKGADINAQGGEYGITPLSWAALLEQTQTAELLIQRGANVNSKNRDGSTSLHSAAFLGRHEIAKLLVQKGADVNARNNEGTTAMDALKTDWGTVQFIAQLLQIQVDREKVESGRAKVAELLSQQGVQTGFAGLAGNDIWTAAVLGNIEAVKQHLAKGVDVNAKNKDGASALHVAAIVGQYEVAELLIQKGADVNFRGNDGGTALHAAAFLGQYEIATLLVQKGADVNARNNDGTTAMNALKLDWETTQFIAQLLQIQVDREKVETGRAKVAELLSQQGAQTGFAGLAGNDIWTAAVLGDIEAVEQQLAKGVDVNAKNKDGTTALHVAAFLGRYEIAALLVHQKGVNTNVRDDDGMTAMDVLKTDWETTQFIAQLLQIQVDREKVETGRAKVAELLSQHATRQKVDMKDKTRAEPKGNGPEKVIAKMLKEEIENFNTGNFKDMTKNLHPTDFSSYSNSPQGKLEYFQKESMIELLEGLSPLLQGIKISGPIDLKVWVHGDAAFATFLTKAEVAGVSSTIRNTTLYINSSEGWKTIHQHQSNLQ